MMDILTRDPMCSFAIYLRISCILKFTPKSWSKRWGVNASTLSRSLTAATISQVLSWACRRDEIYKFNNLSWQSLNHRPQLSFSSENLLPVALQVFTFYLRLRHKSMLSEKTWIGLMSKSWLIGEFIRPVFCQKWSKPNLKVKTSWL